jgi:transcriptional regulator of acetoin/glycerol metabolism
MLTYDWPGNIRELRSVVQYALAGSETGLLKPENLPPGIRVCKAVPSHGKGLDQATVQAALALCGGNKVKAAQLLGVGRATLYRFLQGVS